ncbi:hypothetical protein [Lentzea flava]|uniref:Uncharacterized protein n=1 Tax=Lentzea flava TaxID=103732 RepID=A0ABQ2UGU9_9PSEU|nr:hypothetical protein [Lentzea flava]MCP2198661.1 hypothetical protein [Lentzea flava]GGU29185.1 hypothetical protein GCM10010178_21700 [Lentzea flava]
MNTAEKYARFVTMIAAKQDIGRYRVILDNGHVEGMLLALAQAEGFECLTCKALCGTGSAAFRPIGRAEPLGFDAPGVGRVFRCVACLDGARGGDAR